MGEPEPQSQRDLAAIMETVPDVVYRLDAESRLVAWNRRVEDVTGLAAGELRGRPCSDLILPEERPLVAAMIERCVASGRATQAFHLTRRDGTAIPYEFVKAPIRDADGRVVGFAGVGRDISAPLAAALRAAAHHAATRVLARDLPEEETLRALARELGVALGGDVADVWLMDERATSLRCAATWSARGQGGAFEEGTLRMRFAPKVGLPGRVLANAAAAWIPDLAQDRQFPRAEAALAEGLRSGFAFPIKQRTRVLGVIEVFRAKPTPPDEDLLAVLEDVGTEVGSFLQRKRAEAEIARLHERLHEKLDALAQANHELESLGRAVAEELGGPLARLRAGDDARAHGELERAVADLAALWSGAPGPIQRARVDLAALAREAARSLAPEAEMVAPPHLLGEADERLARLLLERLIAGARGRVELAFHGGARAYQLRRRDDAAPLPSPIAVAAARRIAQRHGGHLWVEADADARDVWFTLAPAR